MTGTDHPELSSGGLQSSAVAGTLCGRVQFSVFTTSTNPALRVDDVTVARVVVRARSRTSRLRATAGFVTRLAGAIKNVDLVQVQGYSTKNIEARCQMRPVADQWLAEYEDVLRREHL